MFKKPGNFSSAITAYDTASTARSYKKQQQSSNWSALEKFTTSLREHQHIPPLVLANLVNFGPMADLAGQSLSACNQKITKDVLSRLTDLYSA
ncbi:uncharacterized protein BYT42DRAFT_573293 [Radiomyces spectabilis]|uniref:uncharacterized protein n=1 Tax=Radiomyces spectabilis TaxID=64574 RepID=UPI0022205913|nr:uncharacterized protein BYT42DRAFT_573293 [Radiomyces spectabilis]KAI8376063.1 hypothetical protein BYT42DRAFT_573293 [Radiomyces spectabilis]